jgi:hypothetical protein
MAMAPVVATATWAPSRCTATIDVGSRLSGAVAAGLQGSPVGPPASQRRRQAWILISSRRALTWSLCGGDLGQPWETPG